MAIITRASKGSSLTHAQMDTNFTDLRDGVNIIVPKAKNTSIKVDSLGTPTFGWADIVERLLTDPDDPTNRARFANFRGNTKALQYTAITKESFSQIHIPHDYAVGTDIFMHIHWAHNSATVTGGSVTWSFEVVYAKGHDQASFNAPKIATVLQNASTGVGGQYRHMLAEGAISISTGSGTQLDSDLLEPDGVILTTIKMNANNITDSVAIPDPFAFFVDVHYQTTGIKGTKNKNIISGDFWT